MTAERIALWGLSRRITLRPARAGSAPANIAGMIAKYFATSLAIENVVSAPRVISICLPISTTSISLVGLESRSTMLPASLAAVVPVFICLSRRYVTDITINLYLAGGLQNGVLVHAELFLYDNHRLEMIELS